MVQSTSLCFVTLVSFTGFLGAASWVVLLPPVLTTRSLCRFSAASSVCENVLPDSVVTGDTIVQQIERRETLDQGKNNDAFIGIMREKTATGTLQGARIAEELLLQMEQDDSPILTNKHYTVVIDAYGTAGDIKKAEEIFQRMKVGSIHNAAIAPSPVTINVLLHAYALRNDDASALALLRQTNKDGVVKLRTVDFNVVMGIFARQANVDGVQTLLSQMRDMEKVKPNIHSYNILLEALGKKLRVQQHQQPHIDMMDVLNLVQKERPKLTPNADTYSHIIQAMGVSIASSENSRTLVDQAEALFQEALENEVEPSASLILGMMNIYANLPDSALRVKALLHQYHDVLTESDIDSNPTNSVAITVAYNTLLKAWKNSSTLQQQNKALDESEKILNLLKAQGLADTISYTTYLGTLATVVGTSGTHKGRQKTLALKANRILQEMINAKDESIKPTTLTYNSVLHSWSASGNMARAEQLLLDMERNTHNDNIYPTIASYTTLMSGWARLSRDGSGGNQHLEEMQNLFDRAVHCHENGNQECAPNQVAYSILIHAYAKSMHAKSAGKAEQLLRRMYQEYKDTTSSGHSPGPSSLVMPNTQLVTAVMDCWRKSGAPDAGQRAEDLLNWMVEVSAETGETAMRPNARSFSSAIAAWARTRAPAKAQRARQLLVKMSHMHRDANIESGPNVYCFTNVINCCAYCIQEDAEKKMALAIAIQTYKELLKSSTLIPTHVTFSAFLTALRNLLPSGRDRTNAIQAVFQRAVKMGQVDSLVLKKIQAALSREDFVKLMPRESVSEDGELILSKIPSEWSENVS